ncbi:hypothetical protein BU15DRAFT_39252 [Melanogaster broomeanus]|nr:hypothetical protein BU15DRAFT_39252 [Melanogaster broomeanus]
MLNSTSEWPVSTTKYRLSLPFALHSISPALSALHATRFSTLHPEASSILQSSHCARCGAYYFSGDAPSHLFTRSEKRKRKRGMSSRPKDLRRFCSACGFFTDPRIGHLESPHSTILQSPMLAQLPSASIETETTSGPSSTKKSRQQSEPSGSPHSIVKTFFETAPRASAQPVLKQLPRPKSNHSKKPSTLQNLLARDRQRAEVGKAHKQTKDSHGGLAAFLKDLSSNG